MAHGSRKRALLVGAGAFLLFGSWTLFANRGHPVAAMARAALAQGCLSFVFSTSAVLLLEYLYSFGRTPARKVMLAAMVTPAILLLCLTGVHLLARTPNVVATLLPSLISGTTFSIVYTLKLRRLDRSAAAGDQPSLESCSPADLSSSK